MFEGLTALLVTLWSEFQPLSKDLLYLVRHNSRERCGLKDWVAEYITIRFIHSLSLDLKCWCISVEEEAEDIDITIIF